MADLHALSVLYEESNDLQMDVLGGEGDLPPMEVGGRGPPQPEEEGPMEEEGAQAMAAAGGRGLAGRPGPEELPAVFAGADFEAEEFDDWEDDYDYPEEAAQRPGFRGSAALDEANKMFLRTSGEAGADGGFQVQYEKTPFDQLAFIEELFSLMVVNRLTEELGCDEIIDKD
ncbi:EP300-interacting inhibitor of differentiation 1 [Pipistrellus kuhlii]|uniref:EP300 interacting inhibitor of differentiation 1 n=1 Tax=Pipistrellus kuhlii TaxID=59472 RepID=A0A7J8AZN7_PIPKU|nr:EP300-interacting inhibitor of differentiation 1 [Pipistrellus kuhlii]KAF6391842.1 hypothetical protein mPipKuh1_004289 [Pipistrellus kuhlii]